MSHHIAGALVTPVILTYNEGPNILRTLKSLDWADEIVIVDSGSTDDTEKIARAFSNVRWLIRAFDNHRAQWNFAIQSAGDRAPYVLALDADYQVPAAFTQEIADHFAMGNFAGGIAGFEYRINGRTLSGSIYPAKLVLFRPERVKVSQPGHSQELAVDGPTYKFKARLIHDDRKSTSRFVTSQLEYSRLEASRLSRSDDRRWQDRLRRTGLMPLIAGVGSYFRAGGPFKGTAALRYAYERTVFECLLALRILSPEEPAEKKKRREPPGASVGR
jgi:glycosyltransferase involved in cell wall biosynthesis